MNLIKNTIKLTGNDPDYPLTIAIDTFDNSILMSDEDSGQTISIKESDVQILRDWILSLK